MQAIMRTRFKLLKNQKGMTLIELLAVVVVLGILAAIAVPAISGTISQTREKADKATAQIIKDAALRYVIDSGFTTDQTDISIQTALVDKGYLSSTGLTRQSVSASFVTFSADYDDKGSWTITVKDNQATPETL